MLHVQEMCDIEEMGNLIQSVAKVYLRNIVSALNLGTKTDTQLDDM